MAWVARMGLRDFGAANRITRRRGWPALFSCLPTPRASTRDWIGCVQERLRGEFSQCDDHFRLHGIDLPKQKRLAGVDFVRLRISIAGRTAFDHVCDVDISACEADRLDDFREQLTGAADERLPLLVFVRARRFADEHQIGVWIADTEHHLLPAEAAQLAAVTGGANLFVEQ